MESESSIRICHECQRLVSESEMEQHPCRTPEYVMGYALGLTPTYIDQLVRNALLRLGLEESETDFLRGFHDGVSVAEELGINKAAQLVGHTRDELEDAYEEGSRHTRAMFEVMVERCHCGDIDCDMERVEFATYMGLQPCHCGQSGCLEVFTLDDQLHRGIRAVAGHIKKEHIRYSRRPTAWER